jgi:transcriptional regulator with XRE-family HTH domain
MHGGNTVKLRVVREQKKLSQWDLAVRAGVSQTWVSLVERGYVRPSEDQREQVAKALGMQADEIQWPGTILTGGDFDVDEAQ